MKLYNIKNVIFIFLIYTVTLLPSSNKQMFLLRQKPTTPETNLTLSNKNAVSFTVKINGLEVNDMEIGEVSYQSLSIPECEVITKEGSPQLPVITKLIAIPDCDNISISIKPSSEVHFLNYNILPAPRYENKKFTDGSGDLMPVFEENKSIYSTNTYFPGKNGEIIETNYVRNQKVACLALYPVQYNPGNKEIKVYAEFNINISFLNPKSAVNKEMGIFRNMTHQVLLNYKPSGMGALSKSAGSIHNEVKASSSLSLSGSVTNVTNLSTLTGNNAIPVDYLIITHSSLFNSGSLAELANHRKNYNGYDVAIVKVDDDVYNFYPSQNHYISIRNFIQDVYLHGRANHTGDGHLGYILLVGDAYLDDNSTEMLPAAYPPFYDELEQGGDYYYACTGGDSDDLLDLMYGRLPVGNENELSNVVNKIISYEYNTKRSWRKNFTFVAGSYGLIYSYADLAITRMTQTIPSTFTKSYAYRALDSDRPTLVTAVDSIFGQRFTQNEYEDPTMSCGARKLSDWLYDDPIAGINSGVHTLVYEGHGSWKGLGGGGCGRQIFKVEDCTPPHDNTVQNRLHNDLYSFMIFCACNTGHFDNNQNDQGDCIAEVVLNLRNRGAIGVVASTRDSDVNSFGSVGSKILNKEFKDSLFIVGEAFMESKLSYTSNKLKRQYNFYGDPALNLCPTAYTNPIISNVKGNKDLNKFVLFNNYPNPFNPSTTIKYSIPKTSLVTLKVYDILGKEVETLVNDEKSAGNYQVEFNAQSLSSGVYLYKIQADNFAETKKMILLK